MTIHTLSQTICCPDHMGNINGGAVWVVSVPMSSRILNACFPSVFQKFLRCAHGRDIRSGSGPTYCHIYFALEVKYQTTGLLIEEMRADILYRRATFCREHKYWEPLWKCQAIAQRHRRITSVILLVILPAHVRVNVHCSFQSMLLSITSKSHKLTNHGK